MTALLSRTTTLLVCLTAAVAAQNGPAWPPDARNVRVHMIGNAHIDPVWLWPWAEGLSVVHSTFRSALDRMNDTPGFVFTASSAQFYEWVAANDPAMLAEIRKRVEEGRWALVGGWWVEPDVNIPNGESLVRQGLYGQLTFERLLGRRARVGFNPDSFGHPGTLPQILKLQGMNDYVFMRPMVHEKQLPADLFWWEGPDGSRVLTYRIPFSYGLEGDVRERVRETAALQEPAKSLMAFYGVGDHGGGATKESLRSIEGMRGEAGAPEVLYSAPGKYFQEIRSAAPALPVVKDDLQIHSVGCYTAQASIKKGNRAAEAALITAEKFAALGAAISGAPYPKAEFTSAWKRVLFLQFHDSLAGTSLPEHYTTTALEGHGYALETAERNMLTVAQRLAWQVPARDPASQYLVVFNPHAWPVTSSVEYELREVDASFTVEDEQGAPVPHQWTPSSITVERAARLAAQVPVPAFGYRQIRVRKPAQARPASSTVTASTRTIENEHLRVTFDAAGRIGIFDKDAGGEVFRGGATGAGAVVLDDPSDTWSHRVVSYDKRVGAFGNARVEVVEQGPLRARVRVQSRYGSSSLSTEWLLYAGARTLEARVTLDWHEHHKMLKFSFPVDVGEARATFETPYGHIVRETNGHEMPGQRWIDVTGKRAGASYGLAVINDAKYGYSVEASDLRVSIARSAVYAHHRPAIVDPAVEHLWQDQGVQTFRMLLAPHRGEWQDAGVVRAAEEFVAPVPVIYQGIHAGSRPESDSFLTVDAPNVVVASIKQAENNDDLIVRCYETAGRPAAATLDLRFARVKWSGRFKPAEIKTLRVNLKTGAIAEVNALEE
jgi:alpha-mannosidase